MQPGPAATGSRCWLVGFLGVLAALVVSGCAADDPRSTTIGATVGIEANGCSMVSEYGTGVAVNYRGETFVVTSAHTVAGARTITVHDADQTHPVTVVAFDPDRDIAVLETTGVFEPSGLALADPQTGSRATVLVWDPHQGITHLPTRISRLLRVTIEDIYVEDRVTRRAFEFDGVIKPGDSGAPVVDPEGRILGIVYARSRSRSVGFAISAPELGDLLDTVPSDPALREPASVGRCL